MEMTPLISMIMLVKKTVLFNFSSLTFYGAREKLSLATKVMTHKSTFFNWLVVLSRWNKALFFEKF